MKEKIIRNLKVSRTEREGCWNFGGIDRKREGQYSVTLRGTREVRNIWASVVWCKSPVAPFIESLLF